MRRARLLLMALMGRGYPKVIYIEAGEDPTKNRLPMIAPLNITLIIGVIAMVIATPFLSFGFYKLYFPPQPTATPTATITPEGTMESTAEATSEPTQESTPTPVILVITATPSPTQTPTATFTPTITPSSTATAEQWPVWMTATAFYREMNPSADRTPIVMTVKETVVVTEVK